MSKPLVKDPNCDPDPNDIVHDHRSLEVKQNVMDRLKKNAALNSISDIAKFVGTFLATAGAGAMLAGTVTAATIGLLSVGAAVIGVAAVASYMSSRIYQSANFDNLEANASSTARHLVKELKVNNMCMTTEQDSSCAHKTDWAATIEAQRQQQEAAVAAGRH
jgi:hypothetical protein